MDPALIAQSHHDDWKRLGALSGKNRLTPAQATEFIALYRAATKDLSKIRSQAPDSEVSLRLSSIVHRARIQLTSMPAGAGSAVSRFFLVSLPTALYSLRWWFVGVFVFFVGIAVISTVWISNDPSLLNLVGSEDDRRQLAERDFVNYYKENPNSYFAVGVWTNNAWIAVQWVVLGITGVYVVYGLIVNALNMGVSGAVMFEFDRAGDFFSYILPHGIPEITCILIAAAAGLKICAAWVIPGPRTRRSALAHEARSLVTVAMGLVIFLFASGMIEGFVTPSGLPVAVKITLGVALTGGIFAYAIGVGRPAHLAGLTGDLSTDRAGYELVAAD